MQSLCGSVRVKPCGRERISLPSTCWLIANGESRICGHRETTQVSPSPGAMIQPGNLRGLQRWRTEFRMLAFRGAMLPETDALPDDVHSRCLWAGVAPMRVSAGREPEWSGWVRRS